MEACEITEPLASEKEVTKDWTCSVCNLLFPSEALLRRHMKKHQSPSVICPTCDKRCPSKTALNTHMLTHTGVKPFRCSTCEKQFAQKIQLENHKLIHTGEKPHLCSVCGKCYRQQYDLVRHQRIHTDERPFECGVCQQKFRMKSVLDMHARIHTGEKPYKCDVCEEAFRVKRTLARHMLVHSTDRQHKCRTCDKAFKRREHLKSHMKTHATAAMKTDIGNNSIIPGSHPMDTTITTHQVPPDSTTILHNVAATFPQLCEALQTDDNKPPPNGIFSQQPLHNHVADMELRMERASFGDAVNHELLSNSSLHHLSHNAHPLSEPFLQSPGLVAKQFTMLTSMEPGSVCDVTTAPNTTMCDIPMATHTTMCDVPMATHTTISDVPVAAHTAISDVPMATHTTLDVTTAPHTTTAKYNHIITTATYNHIITTDHLYHQLTQPLQPNLTLFPHPNMASLSNSGVEAARNTTLSNHHGATQMTNTNELYQPATQRHNNQYHSNQCHDNQHQMLAASVASDVEEADGGHCLVTVYQNELPSDTGNPEQAGVENTPVSGHLVAAEDEQRSDEAHHQSTITNPPFVCEACGKVFKRLFNYNKHKNSHEVTKDQSKDSNKLKSTTSGASCGTAELLVEHSVSCSKSVAQNSADDSQGSDSMSGLSGRLYGCEKCDKAFKTRNGLLYHDKSVHLGTAAALCTECGKELSCRASLYSHMLIHQGAKQFPCSVCHRRFRQKAHLKKHMLHHTGERPYDCTVCAQSFRQAIDLKRHTRTHTGEKPFKCPHCPKAFAVEHCLIAHLRIHTGEKPFSCPTCGVKFRVKVTRDRHMLVHSNIRPYQCNACKQTFRRKDHVTQHWQSKSNDCTKHAGMIKINIPEQSDKEIPSTLSYVDNSWGNPLTEAGISEGNFENTSHEAVQVRLSGVLNHSENSINSFT